ncbi:MAG: anthranilate phosphoribosyltransferase, partial [Planctomycetota bacterium]
MPAPFDTLIDRVSAGGDLTCDESTHVVDQIMAGACRESQIAKALTALANKGETVEEVAGAAQAMRKHMTPIRSRYEHLLDTCGTGGGGSQIFNVSTTAALVVAACGVPVAKHGNRSFTSRCGSADVLAELGVNIGASVPQVERCLDELRICFCFAPLMHPAMKHVAAVRKSLGIRTIFNLLGPLSNPAGATRQLLGVGRPALRPLLAAALERLDAQRALVVCGEDGLGEVTLAGVTKVTEISQEGLQESSLSPEDFGVESRDLKSIVVRDAVESAAMVGEALSGDPGDARDIVVLNAAAGLMAFGSHHDPAAA